VTARNRDTCKFRVEVTMHATIRRYIGIFTGEKTKFRINNGREGARGRGDMKHKHYRYYLQVFLHCYVKNAIGKLINGNFMQCQRSCVNILQSMPHPVEATQMSHARNRLLSSYQYANYAFSANIYRYGPLVPIVQSFPLS